MQSGKLRHQLVIQQKSVTRDNYGGEVVTWASFAEVWGEKRPLRGREYVALQAAQSEIQTRFVVRYVAGVTPQMRILDGSDVHEIVEVIDVNGRNRELELMCRGSAQPV
jgi:SPP1 family predicted phage head-tail adaptor